MPSRPPLTDPLLDWWAGAGRHHLPWRRTRDPWTVLVSEVMLQQTQVGRVIPAFERFIERFPTVRVCAAAPVADVVRSWAGLGYNRRAVNLHRTAAAVVERHGGALPVEDLAALLALPGIGPYTARALRAFAGDADVGVVETNTARVLARAVAGRPLTRTEAQSAADALVPTNRGWDWNSAMLDLGATVCTTTSPRCDRCPVTEACAWHVAGRPEPDPARGTAGASGRQSTFTGSDRQGRGRLVAALREGSVEV
ncbi:MAG: A/G-specific adenine glycosylase, partial [Acidimicrobiales bacterium]